MLEFSELKKSPVPIDAAHLNEPPPPPFLPKASLSNPTHTGFCCLSMLIEAFRTASIALAYLPDSEGQLDWPHLNDTPPSAQGVT